MREKLIERDRKDYKIIPISEQVEVLSLAGTISLYEGLPKSIRMSWSGNRTARRMADTSLADMSGRRSNRTFLSMALEVELEGRWPWQDRAETQPPAPRQSRRIEEI